MQTKDDLEAWWKNEDAWGYKTNPDDTVRKRYILDALNPHAPFKRALDIGCGEGFITRDLPASQIEGLELSDVARKRLPKTVKGVTEPTGKYDLIVATGVLYPQYNHTQITDWIKQHASGLVLTCNIKDWEVNVLPQGKQIHVYEFPYRTYTQVLRLYQW